MPEWEDLFRTAWWVQEGDKKVTVDAAVVWIKEILKGFSPKKP